ncbi:unnamed protein product [Caenorhabditis angaria]|uniref:Uncharacterized protein n=1 Tax=Caenorhabditis angaria TaxID=860376 RepID=A0A9P1IDZ7_9PELO|nr:unnamed protein product [Caenorhabditis angaria]
MGLLISQIQTGAIKNKAPKSEKRGWFSLPYDMRRIIIDSLDLEGKSKLSKCSEDCCEEVMLSRNYVDEIHIRYCNDAIIEILVISNCKIWKFKMIRSFFINCLVRWEFEDTIISEKTFVNKTTKICDEE